MRIFVMEDIVIIEADGVATAYATMGYEKPREITSYNIDEWDIEEHDGESYEDILRKYKQVYSDED